ncbi:aspartyl aminopeptidase [Angomonas deanei]|nr:aspartyl aminopeptidase [Angomonas deanei]|eukprot:EPY40683.1 aspartyl aminopeptidase [Angomonas deanei]
MRIPTLAIHLTSGPERDAFSPNKERHVVPVIATKIAAEVNKKNSEDNYSVSLFSLLAETLGCAVEDIVDFDLSVVDTQDAVIGGAKDEFIFSPRLDNLVSCFCALEGLKKSDSTLKDDNMIRMVCLFDHEEVGSSSSQGAGGTLIPDIIEYIVNGASLRSTLVANSFLLSVDGAHAVHPNYGDKHEENHRPNLHKGPVIKYNANTRYATNGFTGATVKKIAADSNIPLQEFVVKNDSPCGSTIGPILSTLSGIKTADMGNAMLSMHSIREMCGTLDILYLANFLESFFSKYNITP